MNNFSYFSICGRKNRKFNRWIVMNIYRFIFVKIKSNWWYFTIVYLYHRFLQFLFSFLLIIYVTFVIFWQTMLVAVYKPAFALYSQQTHLFIAIKTPLFIFLHGLLCNFLFFVSFVLDDLGQSLGGCELFFNFGFFLFSNMVFSIITRWCTWSKRNRSLGRLQKHRIVGISYTLRGCSKRFDFFTCPWNNFIKENIYNQLTLGQYKLEGHQ